MQKTTSRTTPLRNASGTGGTVTIRAIRPDDKGRMVDALRDVSPESLYRRTFSAKRDLSDDDLKQLTEVDFENVVALVAVMTRRGAGQDRGRRAVHPDRGIRGSAEGGGRIPDR